MSASLRYLNVFLVADEVSLLGHDVPQCGEESVVLRHHRLRDHCTGRVLDEVVQVVAVLYLLRRDELIAALRCHVQVVAVYVLDALSICLRY